MDCVKPDSINATLSFLFIVEDFLFDSPEYPKLF